MEKPIWYRYMGSKIATMATAKSTMETERYSSRTWYESRVAKNVLTVVSSVKRGMLFY